MSNKKYVSIGSGYIKHEHFICACFSPEHALIFCYDEEEDDVWGQEGLWVETYLNQYRSFWKRLWVAVKYVFGYHCKYGHWDTMIFDKANFKKLQDFVNQFDTSED